MRYLQRCEKFRTDVLLLDETMMTYRPHPPMETFYNYFCAATKLVVKQKKLAMTPPRRKRRGAVRVPSRRAHAARRQRRWMRDVQGRAMRAWGIKFPGQLHSPKPHPGGDPRPSPPPLPPSY
jgi:hypothetical protein